MMISEWTVQAMGSNKRARTWKSVWSLYKMLTPPRLIPAKISERTFKKLFLKPVLLTFLLRKKLKVMTWRYINGGKHLRFRFRLLGRKQSPWKATSLEQKRWRGLRQEGWFHKTRCLLFWGRSIKIFKWSHIFVTFKAIFTSEEVRLASGEVYPVIYCTDVAKMIQQILTSHCQDLDDVILQLSIDEGCGFLKISASLVSKNPEEDEIFKTSGVKWTFLLALSPIALIKDRPRPKRNTRWPSTHFCPRP